MEEYIHDNIHDYIHDICIKEELIESIYIECEPCINMELNVICKCREKIVKKIICKKCYSIENKINSLKDQLDHLLFNIGYNVKNYIDCDEDIQKINFISKLLRMLNSILVEKE
jgi:hypothetical protein